MPNGVALSPDGKTLYINNTYDDESWWNVDSDKDNYIWAYDVKEDGTIENGRKFAELQLIGEVLDRKGKSSGADGMKVDVEGNLYIGTWAGIQIFDNKGKAVGIINTPDYPVSCAFGGDDMKTLYIAAVDKIYSIRLNIAGFVAAGRK
jgi:gluconolactonase